MRETKDDELFGLIIAADDEAFLEGAEPKQRFFPVVSKVMKHLGSNSYVLAGVGTDPMVEQITKIHESLYRRSDLAIGGIHGGTFMFRDVFARINIPLSYGKVLIEPLKHSNLSQTQLRWMCSRPRDLQMYLDQFIDIFDFAGGVANLGEYKPPPKEALEIFWLSAFQLQAAAATLSVAFDFRGAIQSALIGAELALKGGLAAVGVDERGRKKHGHNLTSAAEEFYAAYPGFDISRVRATIDRLPLYVENRYSPEQPSRVDTGHIAMGAQYVAGEVMRQVTRFSVRSTLKPPTERTYPAL